MREVITEGKRPFKKNIPHTLPRIRGMGEMRHEFHFPYPMQEPFIRVKRVRNGFCCGYAWQR